MIKEAGPRKFSSQPFCFNPCEEETWVDAAEDTKCSTSGTLVRDFLEGRMPNLVCLFISLFGKMPDQRLVRIFALHLLRFNKTQMPKCLASKRLTLFGAQTCSGCRRSIWAPCSVVTIGDKMNWHGSVGFFNNFHAVFAQNATKCSTSQVVVWSSSTMVLMPTWP